MRTLDRTVLRQGLNCSFNSGKGLLTSRLNDAVVCRSMQELVLHQFLSLKARSNCGMTAFYHVNQRCKALSLNRCFDGCGALNESPPPCCYLENLQELVLHQLLSLEARSNCILTAMKRVEQACKAQCLSRCYDSGDALDESSPVCINLGN